MGNELLFAKLESLEKCITRIHQKCPANANILMNDIDLQDIISVNLERAVQQCVDIAAIILSDLSGMTPPTMASSFIALSQQGIISQQLADRLSKAVGFRNIAVHEYSRIDWSMVFSIVSLHITDFRDYAAAVLRHIDSRA